MSKAYDRVEWSFLEGMLKAMDFSTSFANLIMRCATSVSYTFTFNNKRYGEVFPTRGLRQGDSLSYFLFVICAQGLSALLTKIEENLSSLGFGLESRARLLHIPSLWMIAFIFFKTDTERCRNIKNGLKLYDKALGQMINFDKPAVTFSPNVDDHKAKQISGILETSVVQGHDLYLGLPTFFLPNKNQ